MAIDFNLPINTSNYTDVLGQLRENINSLLYGTGSHLGTSGGSLNAQTVGFDPDLSAYAVGTILRFTAGFTNTGPMTITVDSLAVRALVDINGTALVGGEVVSGEQIICIDTGSELRLLFPDVKVVQNWSPNLTVGAGAGTLSAINIVDSDYINKRSEVQFWLEATFTVNTNTITSIDFTLPINANTGLTSVINIGYGGSTSSASGISLVSRIQTATTIRVTPDPNNGDAWSVGSSRNLLLSGSYPTA